MLVSKSEIAIVRYAYVTIGGIVFLSSVLYAAAYWRGRRARLTASAHQQQVPTTQQTTHREADTEIIARKPAKRLFRDKLVDNRWFTYFHSMFYVII